MGFVRDDADTVPARDVPHSAAHIFARGHHVAAVRVELGVGDGAVMAHEHAQRRNAISLPELGGRIVRRGAEVTGDGRKLDEVNRPARMTFVLVDYTWKRIINKGF